MNNLVRPPFEPHTARMLEAWESQGLRKPIDRENISEGREPVFKTAEYVLRRTGLEHKDIQVQGPAGRIPVAIFRRPDDTSPGPVFINFHGGGLIHGNRFSDIDALAGFVSKHGGVIVSPEYRLAPESPAPAAHEDCLAAAEWVSSHLIELNGKSDQVIAIGMSAGGNLVLGVALACRDQGLPLLAGVMACYPMLDDSSSTCSMNQFWDVGLWTGRDNSTAWDAVLGEREGQPEPNLYIAPSRAEWLGGLPPIYLEVASTEALRDEVVSFASASWRDGADLELHVFPGSTHMQEIMSAGSWIGEGVSSVRSGWIGRVLDPADPQETYDQVKAMGKFPL